MSLSDAYYKNRKTNYLNNLESSKKLYKLLSEYPESEREALKKLRLGRAEYSEILQCILFLIDNPLSDGTRCLYPFSWLLKNGIATVIQKVQRDEIRAAREMKMRELLGTKIKEELLANKKTEEKLKLFFREFPTRENQIAAIENLFIKQPELFHGLDEGEPAIVQIAIYWLSQAARMLDEPTPRIAQDTKTAGEGGQALGAGISGPINQF